MKSLFLLSLSAVLLFSSCEQQTDAHHEQHEQHEHADQADEGTMEGTQSELSLNNGAKWQTDNNTKLHANKLNGIVQAFDNSGDTKLSAYCNLADAIDHELEQLIGDCRMKGPEHEMLHHWLEPVLYDAEQLKKASTEKEGEVALNRLRTDIQKFNQFFQ